jgi:hypothetical protein
MVDKAEETVTDLFRKHDGKSWYENIYFIAKYIYLDDGEITTNGFAIDKENLLTLRAKIMAILTDKASPKKSKQTKVV